MQQVASIAVPHTPSIVYLARFFTGLSFNIPWLVFSSFLVRYVSEASLGLLFAVASIVAAVLIFQGPQLLRRWGIRRAVRTLAVVEIASLLVLAAEPILPVVIVAFVLASTLPFLIYLGLDMLLEASSPVNDIGRVRGAYLVTSNLAVLLSMIAVALFLFDDNYATVFILSAVVMGAVYVIAGKLGRMSSAAPIARLSPRAIGSFFSKPSLAGITIAYFAFQCFGTWAAVYVPLYLHTHAGLSWYVIGIISALSVLPFILFEFPLGFIADKLLGEKEILITGLITLAVGTALISIADGHIIPILAVLLLARTGAAMVESMTETYFFKQIQQGDVEKVAIFRSMQPISSIVAALLGSVALLAVPLSSTFVIFGIFIMLAIPFVVPIQDTL